MKTSITLVLTLTFASGCYCSHRADRFTYEDGGVDIDASDDAAMDAEPMDSGTDASEMNDAGLDGGACSADRECDDLDPCTMDRCSSGVCSHSPDPSCVSGVTTGGGHTCVVRLTGGVACWGVNTTGQIGNGGILSPQPTPTSVVGISDATQVTNAGGYSCARRSTGQVACWGINSSGQLGNRTNDNSSTPVLVQPLNDATFVSSSAAFSCALRESGNVSCWGSNNTGQLGDGTSGVPRNEAAPVLRLNDATALSVGGSHACVVRSASGRVWCWGNNSNGQLGDGTTGPSSVPTMADGLATIRAVAAGGSHVCALDSTGQVFCWGNNSNGQLGDGTTENRLTPVPVVNMDDAVQVTADGTYSCARRASGQVSCWGANNRGQLGDGTVSERLMPVDTLGLAASEDIAAGIFHTCALRSAREVVCWGDAREGQLGDGTIGGEQLMPVTVVGL